MAKFNRDLSVDKASVTTVGCLPNAIMMAGLLLSANLIKSAEIRDSRILISKSDNFDCFTVEVDFSQFWNKRLIPCGIRRHVMDTLIYPQPQLAESKIPDFMLYDFELLFNDIIDFARRPPTTEPDER